MSHIAMRRPGGDIGFRAINGLFLTIICLIIVYPLLYIVSNSFSDPNEVIAGSVWLYPIKLSVAAYNETLGYASIWTGYVNTIFYTVIGTIISVALTLLAAYPLSRTDFRGRGVYMFIVFFPMIFSGGIIPTYLLVRSLGMVDTRWAMILPFALSSWNIIITRTYYQYTISQSLLDAATIDGCSDFRFFSSVVLPLSGAITAVNVLFYAVGIWNQFFWAFLYLNRQELFPLQLILQKILILNTMDTKGGSISVEAEDKLHLLYATMKYAVIIVASLPVLCVYPFVQKYFVRGVMIGALKG